MSTAVALLAVLPVAPALAQSYGATGGAGGFSMDNCPCSPSQIGLLGGAGGNAAASGAAATGGGAGQTDGTFSSGAGGGAGTSGSLNGTNGSDALGGGGGGGAAYSNTNSSTTISGNLTGGNGGNGGTGAAGGGGGGGAGGDGLVSNATNNVSIASGVTIQGGNGGDGGIASGVNSGPGGTGSGGAAGGGFGGNASGIGGGGGGGAGVAVTTSGITLTNNGTVNGGDGGRSSSSDEFSGGGGGGGGAGVVANGITIINNGTISGGGGGFSGNFSSSSGPGGGGDGGSGIVGSNLTIINSGTISAGAGDPTRGGANGNAITFTGGVNSLELQAGSVINGNVVGATGAGTSNTLILGGNTTDATTTFNISAIGGQYQNFSNFQKTGTSTWTLTGTTNGTTPWTLSAGTLSISSDGALGASGGALTFDGGTLNATQTIAMTRAVTLNAGGGTFDIDSGATLTMSSAITGTGGLTKTDTGTLTLSGVNSYTGATTISGGTLALSGSSSIAASSGVSVASGATFDIQNTTSGTSIKSLSGAGGVALGSQTLTLTQASGTFSGAISGDGGLTLTAGTQTLSGHLSYTGQTLINGGTLALAGGGPFAFSSVAVASGATFNISQTTGDVSTQFLSGAGSVVLGSQTLTLANSNGTFSGVISGNGGLVVTGSTPTLSGVNTYTGTTTIIGARLTLSGNGSLGVSSVEISGNGILDLRPATSGETVIKSLSGSGTIRLGAQTLRLTQASGTFAGGMDGTGGVVLTGGTEIFTGDMNYTGGTTINAGATLQIGNGGTNGSIRGDVTNNGTLTFNRGNAYTFAGAISGTGAVNQIGPSTLTLSGANSYTGATAITGGMLALSGTGSIASSSGVSVASGAAFDVSQTTSGASIKSLSGSGSVTLGGQTLTLTQANGTFSGVFSGTGGLTLIGGSEILTGANSSVGAVVVGGGTLAFGQNGTFSATSYETQSGATTTIGATAQLDVAGAFTQAAGSTLNITVGSSNTPVITADTASLSGTLNIAGISNQSQLPQVLMTSANGITGDFSSISIGGFAGGAVDYLTAHTGKSADETEYLATYGLSWTANNSLAHGTFTLTNTADSFDVGVALGDEAANPATGWNGKSLTKAGNGTLILSANNTYTGDTTISAGTLQLGDGGASGSILGNVANNGTLGFNRSDDVTFGGVISGTGAVEQIGGGTTTLSGMNTYTGTTTISGGGLAVASSGGIGSSGTPSGAIIVTNGATFDNAGTVFAISLTNDGTVTVAAGGALTTGGITNNGTFTNNGTVTDDLDNAGLYTNSGIQNANVNSNAGTIVNSLGATWNGNFNTAGIVNNDGTIVGGLTQTAGTTTNNGSITGAVLIQSGRFTGIGSSGDVTVNSGATFQPGSGAAGSSATINGNLTMNAGSIYQVNIAPGTSSFTAVNGTATITGSTVNAIYVPGNYISKQYTILTTTGGLGGTTFAGVTSSTLPSTVSQSLSYNANNAYLDLTLNFSVPGGLNPNQQNVADTLTNYFNTNGIPGSFASLSPEGLSQASGELGTGAQQTTFDAMGQFMGLLTDPFANQSCGDRGAAGVTCYARPSSQVLSYAATNRKPRTDAYVKLDQAQGSTFEQRWRVWGAGFGGSQTTSGNAVTGSNGVRGAIYGVAVGADYLFSPDTLAGFALAGGGTNFSVNGMGSGRSDLFQTGVHLRHTEGPAYVSAALAYGWQDITTDRTVTIVGADHLQARFNANAYSGRLEGGYRFVAPLIGGVGFTPYAATQFTTFDLPAYTESAVTGAGTFALAYGAKSVTDTRSELGLRTDKSFAMADGIATLRGRLAWAYDFNPDRSIAATFQALPGSTFVVNGAAQAFDAALVSASVEKKWLNGWSAAGTFEGEFSNATRSYAGKGVVKYQW